MAVRDVCVLLCWACLGVASLSMLNYYRAASYRRYKEVCNADNALRMLPLIPYGAQSSMVSSRCYMLYRAFGVYFA